MTHRTLLTRKKNQCSLHKQQTEQGQTLHTHTQDWIPSCNKRAFLKYKFPQVVHVFPKTKEKEHLLMR